MLDSDVSTPISREDFEALVKITEQRYRRTIVELYSVVRTELPVRATCALCGQTLNGKLAPYYQFRFQGDRGTLVLQAACCTDRESCNLKASVRTETPDEFTPAYQLFRRQFPTPPV